MDHIYPAMRHYLPNRKITSIVVRSEAEDINLGPGWSDPYELRVKTALAVVEEIKAEIAAVMAEQADEVVEIPKPRRFRGPNKVKK